MPSIARRQYAALYGPTVGDRVRLAHASGLRPSRSPLLRPCAPWLMRAGSAPRAPGWVGEPPPRPPQVMLVA
jgi:hypothetical protein